MIRRRAINTGLPWRVYERYGPRRWCIWYQPLNAPIVPLVECRADDMTKQEARNLAKIKYQERFGNAPEALSDVVTFGMLSERWWQWQQELPDDDDHKYTPQTLATEKIRLKTLNKVFGKVAAAEITSAHWYEYQDIRRAKGVKGGANKELALASTILEYGRRRGLLTINTARGIKRIKTRPRQRRVELVEVDRLLALARTLGPGAHICALAAKAAFLCLRRPSEILTLELSQIGDAGITFTAAKRKAGEADRSTVVEWSPALRETIAEARSIKRRVDITPHVFSGLRGEIYTRSGWGTNWRSLMTKARAAIDGFEPFTLQDNRAGGVSRKEGRGDQDTQNVTMHKSRKMIDSTYDRRNTRSGKPAE